MALRSTVDQGDSAQIRIRLMFDQGRDCTVGVTSPELQLPQGTDQLRKIEINASLEHISFFVCWSV